MCDTVWSNETVSEVGCVTVVAEFDDVITIDVATVLHLC